LITHVDIKPSIAAILREHLRCTRRGRGMNPVLGWALAVLAVATGYVAYQWAGVVLALTVVVFWLLLQFSRALRVMRRAATRPVGTVDNAVMLHTQLAPGMQMLQILPLTGSLGRRIGAADGPLETFEWADAGGDSVRVDLQGGKISRVTLQRQGEMPAADAGGAGVAGP
jgi:hypothetical protein